MSDLRPCPFCGGPAEIWRASAIPPERAAWVACMGRCSCLVSREHKTDADAIAAWNRRAPETTIAEMLPFVEAVARGHINNFDEPMPDDHPAHVPFTTAGQVRAARALLARIRGGEG